MFTSAFIIDREAGIADKREVNDEYQKYVAFLISNIIYSDRQTNYQAISKNSEVLATTINSIVCIYNGSPFEIISRNYKIIADKFLREETLAQKQVERLKKVIDKGCLVQAILRQEENRFQYLIAKLDSFDFLESQRLTRQQGIQIDKKNLGKSALIDYEIKNIENTKITESNVEIQNIRILLDNDAKYFYKKFLEVTAEYSDDHSTETAMETTLKLIDRQFKKEYPYHRRVLRNAFIHYMDSNSFIDYPELIKDVFTNYFTSPTCDIPQAEKDKFILEINQLPDKRKFSKQFTCVPSKIKARIIKDTYQVGMNISLEIDNVDTAIVNEVVRKGIERGTRKSYLKVYTEDQSILNSFKAEDEL